MIAMLLAGGQGSRLGVLTSKLAKPAVAFGGKYNGEYELTAVTVMDMTVPSENFDEVFGSQGYLKNIYMKDWLKNSNFKKRYKIVVPRG